MVGNRRTSKINQHLIGKIGDFTRSLLTDLTEGRSPTVCIDIFRNYCTNPHANCYCSSDLPKGQHILTIKRGCHLRRIDALLRVLLIVQHLLQENKHGSKRDIYYMHPSVFSDQTIVDQAINDICILLHCSRHNLNVAIVQEHMMPPTHIVSKYSPNMTWILVFVTNQWWKVSVGNGLVMGWLQFLEAGRKFDCLSRPSHAHPIPVHIEEVKDIISVAQYILVVEKESGEVSPIHNACIKSKSVFQRLANDGFCNSNRCIVITGRGYPDIPTRRFLRLLLEKLCLPVYCLVDCDPYGVDILCTYRFGSMQMAYDVKFLRVPEIHWLGAFPYDSERYGIPRQCLLPMTAEDKNRTESMLLRCYLQREVPQWRLQLETMLQSGVKFEIEALSVHSLSFLSEQYIPSKIQGGLHI